MYYFSKAIKESATIGKRLWIAFAVINSAVYVTAVSLAVVYGSRVAKGLSQEAYLVESLFLVTLSLFLALAFPFYGSLLFETLNKAAISSNRKHQMVSKVRFATNQLGV